MSCLTPNFVIVSDVSPSGDVIVPRVTGNEPYCGYYINYTGTPELNYYDYYTIDIKYNTGSGVWTFSGNATGFNDASIYIQQNLGSSIDDFEPYGLYTGGLYDPVRVSVQESVNTEIYQFKPKFEYKSNESKIIAVGSGIHKERDVTVKFSLVDAQGVRLRNPQDIARSPDIDSVIIDVLDQNGSVRFKDYKSGYINSITIKEEENKKIFGEYQPNFGVRATIKDSLIGEAGRIDYFVYGNQLEINTTKVVDGYGTQFWQNTETGAIPSGVLDEDFKIEDSIKIKPSFLNSDEYTSIDRLEVLISETEEFNDVQPNIYKSKNIKNLREINLNNANGLDSNKNYWIKIKPFSKIAKGKDFIFGPHKITEKKRDPERSSSPSMANFNYGDSSFSLDYKTGSLYKEIENGSGIIDRNLINIEDYSIIKSIYDENNEFVTFTLPTYADGEWKKTSFDYVIDFKGFGSKYNNASRKIKINATGESTDPINSGMPLFSIEVSPSGQNLDIDISYNESGFHLLANTGHSFDSYKYTKNYI